MDSKDLKLKLEEFNEKFGQKESAIFIGKKIVEKIGKEKDFFSLSIDEVFEKATDAINDMHIELNKNDKHKKINRKSKQ